jgi:hypothetical protein
MPAPPVFLLDMDGTFIGDATHQLCQSEVYKAVGITYKHNIDSLVRPHFESFVKGLMNECNAEFFVYTAADPTWALGVIRAVEKSIGFKFNRPIFARNDCTKTPSGYKKSIPRVLPKVYATLRRRYKVTLADLDRNIVLLDNNKTIFPEDDNRFMLCPTYDAFTPRDVLTKVEPAVVAQHHTTISAILFKYGYVTKSAYRNDAEFLCNYYAQLSKLIQEASKQQRNKPDDVFFLELEHHFRSNAANIRKGHSKSVL